MPFERISQRLNVLGEITYPLLHDDVHQTMAGILQLQHLAIGSLASLVVWQKSPSWSSPAQSLHLFRRKDRAYSRQKGGELT